MRSHTHSTSRPSKHAISCSTAHTQAHSDTVTPAAHLLSHGRAFPNKETPRRKTARTVLKRGLRRPRPGTEPAIHETWAPQKGPQSSKGNQPWGKHLLHKGAQGAGHGPTATAGAHAPPAQGTLTLAAHRRPVHGSHTRGAGSGYCPGCICEEEMPPVSPGRGLHSAGGCRATASPPRKEGEPPAADPPRSLGQPRSKDNMGHSMRETAGCLFRHCSLDPAF